jgi:type IV pilus assembly protein PilP
MKRLLLPAAMAILAAGCSSEIDQLKQFVRDSDKGLPRRVEPLPAVKPFEPFTYEGFDLPDPFKPRKIQPVKGDSKLAPDLNRRREPLESFPLESLSMVGTLARNKQMYALVKTPEKDIYQVRAGNYLGQNFGVVTDITESEIKMKELVQDGSGDWTERTSALQLQQTADTRTQGSRR